MKQLEELSHKVEQARNKKSQGQHTEAIHIYEILVADHLDNGILRLEFGEYLLQQGHRLNALPHLQMAAKAIDHPSVRALYAETLSKIRFGRSDPQIKTDVQRAINESWCRPADLVGTAISLLKSEYDFSPESATSMVTQCTGLVTDPLFLCILRHAPITVEDIEDWLINARRALLKAVSAGKALSSHSTFATCLAMQMWINEYAYESDADEVRTLNKWKSELEQLLDASVEISEIIIATYASYRPLSEWAHSTQLLFIELTPLVNRLITWHLRDTHAERNIAKYIPSIGVITDQTSKEVRAQYEESPYPRWISAPCNIGKSTLTTYLNNRFSHCTPPYKQLGTQRSESNVLIAGCGTGQQLMGTTSLLINTSITAIDISLASLSYAKRITRRLGVSNINFFHADILDAHLLDNGPFDLIECAGVLHHLADPEAGWKILTDLLAPNGVMLIALYSRAARIDLDAARHWVQQEKIKSTPDNIRKFRTFIKQLPTDDPRRKITQRRDFYTVSMLRDLVFHVNEYEFNLMEIESITSKLGLEFIDFDVPPETKSDFLKLYPSSSEFHNLRNWHSFEINRPDSFRGMYQMWFQKKS